MTHSNHVAQLALESAFGGLWKVEPEGTTFKCAGDMHKEDAHKLSTFLRGKLDEGNVHIKEHKFNATITFHHADPKKFAEENKVGFTEFKRGTGYGGRD